ncbi:glycosyltransferase [Paracoccus sp. Z118]|uniref:glycosyltransferase family 8 protein n=1 Tax=Paracoccus sp. Z118 TaxID=2851017 RepID=UPI001C2CA908|nr:glycosyltransferase [Paracoccus sp. Z118]MBV0891762.1 glycosyltransferase [Paracoccus sp. Z118]
MTSPVFLPGFAPGHDCAVIVACDAAYLPYAAVPALQLTALPQRGFDVLIGSPELLALPAALTDAGIAAVGAMDVTLAESLPGDVRRTLATYMDVFLAGALAGVYRRILVLDADVVFERGDPARLLAADMRGRALAAVRDNRQWRNPAKLAPEFRTLGWTAAPYFNAGVVMIDPEAWAAQDLPARCTAFARQHLARLGRDQALLNGVLHGGWAEISPLWNWQFTWASSHLLGMADPFAVHFIGPLKPWLASSAGTVPMRYRSLYARLPDDIRPANLPEGLERRHWPQPRALRRALGRQWRAAGPMLAYLNRFPDPYALRDPA